jgi:hypothetical protein
MDPETATLRLVVTDVGTVLYATVDDELEARRHAVNPWELPTRSADYRPRVDGDVPTTVVELELERGLAQCAALVVYDHRNELDGDEVLKRAEELALEVGAYVAAVVDEQEAAIAALHDGNYETTDS